MPAAPFSHPGIVAVFAPGPRLTVTVEHVDDRARPHLHAGGQGPWVARMAAILGARVLLCLPLGGESGSVVHRLLDEESGVEARVIDTRGDTAMYVHERHGGDRTELITTAEPHLDRHELDNLFSATLGAALESAIIVLTGTLDPDVIPAGTFARLVENLHAAGATVVADLSGEQLIETIENGADLVKVSSDDLAEDGLLEGDGPEDVVAAIGGLRRRGARDVIVSRAGDPAIAAIGDRLIELEAPPLSVVDHRGAGDSLTGAVAAALARQAPLEDALRLGAAAGALNVTRHGLATGERDTIELLAARVSVRPLDLTPDSPTHRPTEGVSP